MASFTALNAVSEVVDTETRTKELQLEEAVKTYQKALQLHQEQRWAETERAYLNILTTEIILERASKRPGATIVDSPQSRLQRLVLKNYAQFIMDVLPTRPPETVEQMLPLAMKYFAESLCYSSEDIASWLQIVKGAMKMGRGRLLRFALESILYESLKATDFIQEGVPLDEDEDLPILPPVAYRAVEGLLKMSPEVLDTFSYDVQLSRQIAQSVGINEPASQYLVKPQGDMECEHLRVEADNWFRLGKCLLNAFSKLEPEHLVGATVRIVPLKKDRQSSTHSHTSQLPAPITTTATHTDDMEDVQPTSATESKSAKRRRSTTSEIEVDSNKRRLSKRVRALEESTLENENTRTQEFIQNLNSLLNPLGLLFGEYSTMEFFRANTESTDRALDVWKNFLWEWTTERALPFETTYKQKSTSHVADTLLFERAAGVTGTTRTDPDRVSNGSFEKFSASVDDDGLHLGQTAVRWLELLLVSPDASYGTERWATEFLDVVTSVTIMYEDALLDRVKALFTDGSFMAAEQIPAQEIEFAQALFELLVNELFFRAYERSLVLRAPSLTGSKLTLANEKFTKARDRASRWKFIVGDLIQGSSPTDKLALRYRWTCVVIAVCDSASDEILFDLFNSLKEDMSGPEEIRIRLPNCPAVHEISAQAASREISKLQTIDYFRKMLQSSQINDLETIAELKKVLHPDPGATGTLAVVQEFISGSSLDFRLSLLHRLEELLFRSGSPVDALKTALCRSLQMVGENLNTYDETEQVSPRQREETFLKTLKTAQSLVARSLNIIDESGSNLLDWMSPTELTPPLEATTTILRILTVFSLYEDAVEDGKVPIPVETKYPDFCTVMRDMLCEAWRLFYLLFRRVLGITSITLPGQKSTAENTREKINRCLEVLSIVHEEFGVHKWCGYGDGKFLTLMMDQFLKYNTGDADHEVIQCMFCLFGISVSNDNGYPFLHGTTTRPLDGTMAIRIAQFLVHLHSDKRPGFVQLKADYKLALDTVCKSIDHPSLSAKHALGFEVNAGACDSYLREYIDPLKFLTCVKGNLVLTATPLSSDGLDIEDLYYMQGNIHLNQFRARVKSNRSGGEDDLTLAIDHFRKDLLFHPDRWDTWYALGQTYTLESESTLGWTADRIEGDRKTIARYQRKSILCFMMAVSCFVQGNSVSASVKPKKLAAPMYFEFGWQIYNSCRPPMEMAAFANDTYKISSGDRGLYVRHRSKLTMAQVLGFAAQCFNSSFTWGHQDWRCSYMLGKCCSKLKHSPTLVLNWYKNAVESAPERSSQGSGELVLDPHYKIIAVALKYVLNQKITVEDAMPYILSTSYCPRVTDISYIDRNSFLDLVLTSFRNIKSADKKHWHHRPIYRIAHLLEVARWDIQGAKLEMDNIVGGANKVKALVSIWRPEFERAGRHFVYAFKYVMYYIHLLEILKDRDTLRLIAPKIRKASVSIVNHTKAWEYLCTTYLRLLREHWAILPNLDSYPQEEFNAVAERIELHYMPTEHVPLEVKILRDVASLRKLNNNLISVSWMDDFLVDCYMKIYKLVRNDGRRPETAISVPSTSREASVTGDGEELMRVRPGRVSRKEILQKVFALCKPAPTHAKARGKNVVSENSVADDDLISLRSMSRPPSPGVTEMDSAGV